MSCLQRKEESKSKRSMGANLWKKKILSRRSIGEIEANCDAKKERSRKGSERRSSLLKKLGDSTRKKEASLN